jgi:ABC-type spermidine/putrescine transport system permease subunit II
MRQIINTIFCVFLLAPLLGIFVYAFFAEDPVQAEIGREAMAAVRECAHTSAAYNECR